MSTIGSDLYTSLGLTSSSATATKKKEESLGQADFLKLMTEQLQHQDPLKPMENSAFLGQLAQFSTVQGIGDLNTKVSSFSAAQSSDQVLKGASLVGHNVLVPSAQLAIDATNSAKGVVAATSAGTVNFEITDANGAFVKQLSVPASAAGEVSFAWDGTDANGNRMAAGKYGVTATQTDTAGAKSKLSTYVDAPVDSVTIGSDGLYLNLTGLGTSPLANVLRVS
ncbi:flagellar basal body rod modification protein [Xanthomonas arboricola pv. juglandis]|jgi:flagellar basal-body rod modification protein FlgD|uniref:Basal-body rod modification protein FlgD n=1 Tax=Xanthomonas euroxanthea TaxID=2259622 RepID=A0A8E4E0H5_9XANT|nr:MULTISPECIES: flagellar hook capping FlgD N-terminal domain-containing protein [Xanthomonas]PPT32555.1 flagellar basal body rod modification protein [Xanthomonas arboricola]SYZ53015.1 flagellar basal body rod modification protein [Xanthomonas arboricola pv. juglandis]MBB3814637.1 flagellar basal-body rod modification protein FlgD [Xanthomonas euroxanthea]MBB5769241.1 flagellar basal-body rod modification protein FlgD [Xanthomonas euroxanthea]NIJ91425.1 flagellar basal-body rod modification 